MNKSISSHALVKFLLLFLVVGVSDTVEAQQALTPYSDQNKLIRAPQATTQLGSDLFGDTVNLYTGTLEFIQNDVSLAGNSTLPVAVGRHIKTGQDWVTRALFGRWDIEIPHLHGVFSEQKGWATINGTTARCSQFSAAPDATSSTASWKGTEYWHGSFLYVPGIGDQEMLQRSTAYSAAPTGNSSYVYPIVTRNNWAIRCLPSMATGNDASGEAFIAVSPDGTEYRFDWLVSRPFSPLLKASSSPESASAAAAGDVSTTDAAVLRVPVSPQLSRVEVWILPTRITDRYGNEVIYTYDTTNRWQLKSISSNESSGSPRTITLTYETPGSTVSNLVSSVSDGTRTWRYSYNGDGALQTVTLPDGSAWQLGGIAPLLYDILYLGSGSCDAPGYLATSELTGTMTHPSGATGNFTLTPTRHGRAGVENDCRYDVTTQTYTPTYPKNFDTYSLTKKSLTGPGLTELSWTTRYPSDESSWAPCNSCQAEKTVSVTDPAGNMTNYTFGTLFRETEGQLVRTEVLGSGGETVRSTTTRYREPVNPFGNSLQRRGDGIMAARVMEVDQRVITQQGTDFTWEASQFDGFARPTLVSRFSSIGTRRDERTVYADNLNNWVLGQVKTVTETGGNKVMVQNEYDSKTGALLSTRNFGKLQQSMTYNADGTVKTVADEKGQTTTFSGYTRGVAKRIDNPDGSVETATVNNIGKITSLTSEVGTTQTFGYDAMGRLASISYPSSDSTAWNQTLLSFTQINVAEHGLGNGHWKQVVQTGKGVEMSFYDALWRPVYVERYDSDDQGNTVRIVKRDYDFEGRPLFESYPQRSYDGVANGIFKGYDALGRITGKATSSELGTLYEYYAYIGGFQTHQVDAKSNNTVYRYQAFDDPTAAAITGVSMPEGVSVDIARDVFGKAKSITRSGNGVGLTRSYVYDGYERLCKTVEPETGSTIQDYDVAGNVSWRATGLSLPSTTSCDSASVVAAKKTTFGYDARNRLRSTLFGDGSPSITRTYTLDGLLETVLSNGTQWTYGYNKRRLLESESLSYGGKNYSIGRVYDANGSLSQVRYPVDNLTILYSPNALGEPRQISNGATGLAYARGITYHPNGAIAGFIYGNGIQRSMTQTVRGLPNSVIDTGVLNDLYAYDANANVVGIQDRIAPYTNTRGMSYDGLDRLLTVGTPNLWGTAGYTYDALDNIVASSVSDGQNARYLTHTINRTTNRLTSISGGPTNFNFTYDYDAQGNITKRGSQQFAFDLNNRMTSASGRATYVYDGLGRRASVVGTDSVNRIQVYSQEGQLLYTAPSGGTGTKYIYLHNHQIAEVK